MARLLKWLLFTVIGLVVLVIAAIAILIAVFDPNDYREEIARQVENRTGRELVIEGDLELTFWPWLGIELGRSRLADAPGFGDQPFASLERMRLGVEVWPLLSERKVVLDKIVVDGLSLRLIRNAQGRANWELLMDRLAQERPEEQQPAEPEPESDARPTLAVESRGGIEISNASLLYEDRQAGQSILLQPLNLNVSELELGKPMPVSADWLLKMADQPEIGGKLTSSVVYDLEGQKLSVDDLVLDLLARGSQLPAGELPVKIRGALNADLAGGVYKVPALSIEAAGLVAHAVLEARAKGEAVTASGSLEVPQFNPRDLMQRLQIEAPVTADPEALTAVSAQTRFSYADDAVSLPELKLQLDDTSITGDAGLPSLSPLAIRVNLAVDRINLDRYLPPESEQPQQPGEAPAPGQEDAGELPVDMLRQLNINGALTIGELIVKGLTVKNVKTELKAANGLIQLDPASAQLYEGSYKGSAVLDVRGRQPMLTLNQSLVGIQAEPLLTDLTGEAKLLGKGDFSLKAAMVGQNVDQWLQNLSGNAAFQFADGAIAGINLADMIRRAQAKLTNQPLPAEDQTSNTDFSALKGTLVFDDGVAVNRDLTLMSPLLRVTGNGKLGLVKQSIDYLLTVNLVSTLEGQGGKELDELRNIPIPIRIGGSFTEPSFKVDLVEAIKQSQGAKIEAAKEEAKARLEAEKEELRKKAEEKAGGALRDLLERRFK